MIAVVTALTVGAAIAGAADKKNPTPPPRNAPQPGAIDPATGLPVGNSGPTWKDPEWKDPDKRLTVSYDGLPVEEVARDLRKQFNEAFDVVIPKAWQPTINSSPFNSPPFEAASVQIKIQLKNVTASELFNAMNLMFEAENTPLRWELKMNGSRPTVVVRVLPMSVFVSPPPEPPQRKIIFVGEMVGDEKAGKMTMEQLVKTISEVYEMSYGASHGAISDHLQFHKQAQLLIVTGSVDEVNFVMETLSALVKKAEHSRRAAEARPRPRGRSTRQALTQAESEPAPRP